MIFNSIDFAVFLPIVFMLYWFVARNNLKFQNALLVIASYVFYGWWDWRFLALLMVSTIVDYSVGLGLANEKNSSKRLVLLWVSILTNLGLLGFFKYFDFFVDNFVTAFSFFGMEIRANSLEFLLPVGISFYTFQTLSYSIDVYKEKLRPTRNFLEFSVFVSFFPQLVAGPIERAVNLLPQFSTVRTFDYVKAVDGLRQILWGLFKKIVIADRCAEIANMIFNDSTMYSGSTLLLGAVFFAFQIYGDFSGYSDIAIGTARLFGIDLMRNFAYPYFSRDIAEFWRRWHISLSTWFRDYLYVPLGGSRGSTWMKVRNTLIIFIVSGFWHGANWTFIAWGTLNAVYFIPLLLYNKNRENIDIVARGKAFPIIRDALSILLTFLLTVLAWVFFRAENISHAVSYIATIFSSSLFTIPEFQGKTSAFITTIFIVGFMSVEWIGRETQFALEHFGLSWRRPFRYCLYYMLIILIFQFAGRQQQFIYFQF